MKLWKKLFSLVVVAMTMLMFDGRGEEMISSEKRRLIQELLEVSGARTLAEKTTDSILAVFERQFSQTMLQSLAQDRRMNPERRAALAREMPSSYNRFARRFREEFPKRIDIGRVSEEISFPLYDKYFTERELRDLIAFYKTSTGQKTLKVLPQLMAESMQRASEIMEPKVMNLVDELLKEEKQRLLSEE